MDLRRRLEQRSGLLADDGLDVLLEPAIVLEELPDRLPYDPGPAVPCSAK